ncbi:MAG: ribosome maturation factor RimM [Candidatus Sericytochromatia bacterium]
MAKPPEYLTIAQVITTFGVRGDLKVRSESDDPLRLKGLGEVSALLPSGERLTLAVKEVQRRKDGQLLVKFEGYDSPEAAAALRQAQLQVPYAQAKRKKGQVLFADVLGLAVVDDATGDRLGTVTEVYKASQDILGIETPAGEEVLLPWVEAFVKNIDLEAKEVRVTPIEGLFE